ncbi:MAG: carbohydrate kinase family protein [Chloroflexota bacterium]|nr:carbohydrate kinase family protein [Chloroflexota bacterium]
MVDILVIGGASLDRLHFAGRTAQSPGGAGLYTAAAAHRAGATVAMLAPRPDPVPRALEPAAERIDWIGPLVPPKDLPHFEIAHYGGGRAELVTARWGAEARLTPQELPGDLSGFSIVHIAALGSAERQLAFLRSCRLRGASRISVGTYARVVVGETETVRALLREADLFFMNENEAAVLFADVVDARTQPGKLLFITLGEKGARVCQGDRVSEISPVSARELDPTGAGDTFCGTTLALLARHEHPVLAAEMATALAAQVIESVGPSALWRTDPLPRPAADRRVIVNPVQVDNVAALIADLPEVQAFDFTGPEYPPEGHPATLGYFFTATLQQFGFWSVVDDHYSHPLLAPLDGAVRKGSDYLWQSWLHPLAGDRSFYHASRQVTLTPADLSALFRADDGCDPMPAQALHLEVARSYGRDMMTMAHTPAGMVQTANRSAAPLGTFLSSLDHVGGYKEDPLRKKASLLALILAQRPERFLRPGPSEAMPPIIDYHLMRSCLRTGLLEVTDPSLEQALIQRQVLDAASERAVRRAAYRAVNSLVPLSGKSMGAVDWFFFNARRRCPEMTEPDCSACAVDPVCAQRKTLFQPVFRTTCY